MYETDIYDLWYSICRWLIDYLLFYKRKIELGSAVSHASGSVHKVDLWTPQWSVTHAYLIDGGLHGEPASWQSREIGGGSLHAIPTAGWLYGKFAGSKLDPIDICGRATTCSCTQISFRQRRWRIIPDHNKPISWDVNI